MIKMLMMGAFCLIFGYACIGQKGISFEKSSDWEQILAMAKAANKYVFVDCYASWCGPCKAMDQDIYPNEDLGAFVNTRFVSIKMQMDSTENDDSDIKALYASAHKIAVNYKIGAYPSFLFLDSSGKIVHRAKGYRDLQAFKTLVQEASDTNQQYYTLLDLYRKGRCAYAQMPYLSNCARDNGDTQIFDSVAAGYVNNYLLANRDSLLTGPNIGFVGEFVQNTTMGSTQPAFQLFYRQGSIVDSVIHKGYASDLVDYVVGKEEIYSHLIKNGKPVPGKLDWPHMYAAIRSKYTTELARRNILAAKLRWYTYLKNWDEVIKLTNERVRRYGPDTTDAGKIALNNFIYEGIFMQNQPRSVLLMGLRWIKIVVDSTPDDAAAFDTYANLLYKLGQKETALEWEAKAAAMAPWDNDILSNFEKMKAGRATWLTE